MSDETEVVPRPEGPEAPVARSHQFETTEHNARPAKRKWSRWALFALLPIALILAGYWYVTGGAVTSTDDAYVEAEKVGVATDVAGIVKDVGVTQNQHVEAGQVLYRLDDLPFRFALERAQAQVGVVRNSLTALRASYRDMQAQIGQGKTTWATMASNSRGSRAWSNQALYRSRVSTRRVGTSRTHSRSWPRWTNSLRRSPPI
jgi:membrane fusion protein, multidrug efflux system